MNKPYFLHQSSYVDEPCIIGDNTNILHFCHIMNNCEIGSNCNIGQNVVILAGIKLGNNVNIQNNVSLCTGVRCEDDVFLGSSCVFTNVVNSRRDVSFKDEYRETLVKQGATIGANVTIVGGHNIGKYAFVGAGAVVTKEVPDYAIIAGNPTQPVGWMCQCGEELHFKDYGPSHIICNFDECHRVQSPTSWNSHATCTNCNRQYGKTDDIVEEIEKIKLVIVK
jgi:UDP-2-acetamido-3-amino-2,3-dideoxy-glucuronate N-acetyltransferase